MGKKLQFTKIFFKTIKKIDKAKVIINMWNYQSQRH